MSTTQAWEAECAARAERVHLDAAHQIASDLTWESSPEFRAETIRRWAERCARADRQLQEARSWAAAEGAQRN
jgi:hypothetical protein